MTTRIFSVATPDGALLRVQEHAAAEVSQSSTEVGADLPTVVLAHGWTLTRESWLPVVEQLVAAGVRVVTYDQRGHGGSSPLRGQPTVRLLGDDLAAVLDVVQPHGRVVLGGHSMGGMTVMAYAGLHPEEFRARVAGAVLVATSAGELQDRLPAVASRVMALASRMPGLPAGRFVTRRGQRRLLFGADAQPAHVQLTRDMVAGTPLPTMGRFFGALGEHDESEALSQLAGMPTVVLVGDRDRLTPPRHGRRLAELVPHAELRILPGCGHMLVYEATDEVLDAFHTVLDASIQPEVG
ncbi:pimeloyl-ACP methyl ester carboxylesterase [Phycicoccus badiiscoriae]|uniref:Pimeloyl-ACP methyl ester carboxylesterase n=1 Tax=Pedococcus badiiscoriae TaxID=642776 RepID=A0A852WCN1_9MICO|nr:alpha/beta hydrolase [Pedococcus badiiscoriae]NYG07037.1 pimeloyl-ACP methyl ester carboxylesterase [Pedococcus badiiscoriae]